MLLSEMEGGAHTASPPLEFEDLRRTCRRDSFCQLCMRAFCSHCCGSHHPTGGFHNAIPVDVDAAGRPVFSLTYKFRDTPRHQALRDAVLKTLNAQDYAAPIARDSYCTVCRRVFCADGCSHHRLRCRPGAVLRIRERGGAHCIPCTGSEPWFPDLESILGEPVGEVVDEHGRPLLLLPVLQRAPGTCVYCGGQVQGGLKLLCSYPCAAAHRQVLARRKARRAQRARSPANPFSSVL